MGRKQTTQSILDSTAITLEPNSNQVYAKVLGPRGNHLHEVEFVDGTTTLVTLPPRFRNLVWVKRGHYVIVSPLLGTTTEKVGGEIINVIFPKHIKELQQLGQWPAEFSQQQSPAHNDKRTSSIKNSDSGGESESENDDDLFVNNNRHVMSDSSSEEDSDED